jgi:hypothetical protein
MRSAGLDRRGFLGALGALTALVVATPLAARTVCRPPAALTEKTPPPIRGMAVDMSSVAAIYRRLYTVEYAKDMAGRTAFWLELRRG